LLIDATYGAFSVSQCGQLTARRYDLVASVRNNLADWEAVASFLNMMHAPVPYAWTEAGMEIQEADSPNTRQQKTMRTCLEADTRPGLYKALVLFSSPPCVSHHHVFVLQDSLLAFPQWV